MEVNLFLFDSIQTNTRIILGTLYEETDDGSQGRNRETDRENKKRRK